MRPSLSAALVLCLAAGGCGRLVLRDDVSSQVPIAGADAAQALFASLPPALQFALGGSLPDTWPSSAPPVSVAVTFGRYSQFDRAGLEAAGADLASVVKGNAVLRVAGVTGTFDPGTLNQPVVAGALLVGPPNATAPTDPGVVTVGYFTGLTSRGGPLVFEPGGRGALARAFASAKWTLLVRLVMDFDAAKRPEKPAGDGTLGLDFHLDVLE